MAADGSVVIEITGDDKQLKASLGALGGVASAALKGVTTAVVGASTAVAGLAVAAAKVGSAFETALAGTSTMFGDVEVDTNGLTNQILALSNASGIAAADITGSLYNALSAGIPVTEDMTGAMDYMESSSKLAAAGFTDIDTAVTATAKVMNAYGMGLDEVDSIHKVMLQTQNKGITTVNELGATLAQVTPTAAAMGVSFENVGAALATMTAQGTPTAQATTQLNSLLAELGKSGTSAALNLEKAAAGTAYAGKSFSQLMDEGVPLNDVLDLMGNYADANGLSMIDMFSSLEAGKAALAMAGDNSATFADNLAAMSTEADVVGSAYAKVTDTLAHKVSLIKEGISNLGIAVYGGMSDHLKDAADIATGWLGEITSAFTNGGLQGAVGALGSVLAQAITYLAGLAPKMIQAGVGLLTALLTGIQNNLPALAQGAVGIVTSLTNGIVTLLPQLAITAVQLLAELARGIAEALPTLIPAAVGAITTLVQGLIENTPALIDAALQLVLGLLQGIVAAIPVLLEAIPTIITSLVTALLESIPLIIQAGIDLLTTLVTALPEIITTIVAVLPQIIDGIITALLDSLPLIVQAGIDLLVALIQALPTIITTIVTALPQIITSIVNALVNNIPLIVQAGIDLLVALIQNLPAIIVEIVKAVPQIVEGIVKGFAGLAGSIVDIGSNIVSGIWDGISSMGGWIQGKVTGFFHGIVDEVKDFLGIHSPSRVFAGIGRNINTGLAEGMDDSQSLVVKTAQRLNRALIDKASALQKQLADMAVKSAQEESRASEKAHQQAISEKYEKLHTAEHSKKQDVLEEIAQMQDEYDRKLAQQSQQVQEDSLKTQLTALQHYQSEYQKSLVSLDREQGSFADKLSGYGDLFSKTKNAVGESLQLRDLSGDIQKINDLGAALGQLKDKGLPKELLGKVAAMNVDDGLQYANKLLALNDSAYEAYIANWQTKQDASAKVAAQFYQDQRDTLYSDFINKLPDDLSSLTDSLQGVGVDAMNGFNEGLELQGQKAITTARQIADQIISTMQVALDIHSPSRKMRDLVGVPTAQGFFVGFEEEMGGFHKRMQAAVDAETNKVGLYAAAQAEGKASSNGVTREVYKNTNTVEKVAQIEGDGVTGELVRMLGLRLKTEDNRVGDSLED